jgi:peptidoglycan/LPS O-acetylase OafA/YrhL
MPAFTWTWFVVTWSLAIEEQFYLPAPPLIRFLTLRRFTIVLCAPIVLAPLPRFMLFRYRAPETYLCVFSCPAARTRCPAACFLPWAGAMPASASSSQSFQGIAAHHCGSLLGCGWAALVAGAPRQCSHSDDWLHLVGSLLQRSVGSRGLEHWLMVRRRDALAVPWLAGWHLLLRLLAA